MTDDRAGPARVMAGNRPPYIGSDRALTEGLREGDPGAKRALFSQYSRLVQRVLARVMGLDPELPDLVQEVFVRAFANIGKVRNADALGDWLTSIAIFTARGCIRRRKRWRWLRFVPEAQLPVRVVDPPVAEDAEALRTTYALLDRLAVDDRIVFAMRHFEQMELTEVASATHTSLATLKRRLSRAETRFAELARGEPALASWVERGRFGKR